MIKYVFKDEPLTILNAKKASAQKIGERLAAITATKGGKLTPQAVVADAQASNSPLHKHFEWDDTKAANSWRLDQARTLIRAIHVEDMTADEAPRAFLSITDKGGVSYRTLGDVKASPDLQLLVLKRAESDLAAFEDRYKSLKDICEDVRATREKVAAKRAGLEPRTAA